MILLVGRGRRLTLRELQAVAVTDVGSLQWQPFQQSQTSHGDSLVTTANETVDNEGNVISRIDGNKISDESPDLSEVLDQLCLNSKDSSTSGDCTVTYPETIAFLTVLAMVLSQGRSVSLPLETTEEAASKIVHVVNQSKKQARSICFPSRLAEQVRSSLYVILGSMVDSIPLSVIERTMLLSSTALQVTSSMDLAAAALPISALTVDSSGLASKLMESAYNETAFDVLRPHRCMITAAACLRALLNDSRFKRKQSTDNDTTKYDIPPVLADIPQYHGPASEDIKVAAKRLELELNGSPLNAETQLDPILLSLVQKQVSSALRVILSKCQGRISFLEGHAVEVTDDNYIDSSLPELVISLREALTLEARVAITTIYEADALAAEEARQKDVQKSSAAAAHASNGADGDKNEFAGMSEAQKAKILKKRAEKEAKIAAKKQAKEQKGVSLFGAGTHPVCKILVPNSEEKNVHLTIDSIRALVELQDKLLSGGAQRKPKIPKGTRDYLPEQMMVRQQAFDIIRRVFHAHGAVEIDTPVFELKDTLTGKYGEDSKLIYDLADQGGELLALRYDLTVPFARFLSLNSVGNIKRFHIGKVYRRDQPALKRGRYREFYQCDFDIAGNYSRMVPDSECICVACDILHNLPIGDFGIKLNHRRLLDAILDICGVPSDKFRTICSAIDKLDKEPWVEVKREMIEDKGLSEDVAEKIGTFVLHNGQPFELYKELMDTKRFGNHVGALEAMEDLRILFEYLQAFDKIKFVSFDLSLARGLDYYTGVIYEAVCMNGNTQVGSIGGGGRYDNLVSMFQESAKQTPCVGVSIGIERVFTLMEERLRAQQGGSIKQPTVNVLIAGAGDGMILDKMRIARILWNASISAEFNQQDNLKLKKEVVNALDSGIPFMIIIGENELKEEKVVLKDLTARTEESVLLTELVATLRRKGVIPVGCEFAAELMRNESLS